MKCYLLVWAFTAAEVLMLQAAVPASMPRAVHACGRCAAGARVVQIHVCVLPLPLVYTTVATNPDFKPCDQVL